MRIKNKKVKKLRLYRDKLLMRITNMEGAIRYQDEVFSMIRKCLQRNDTLRAYALASETSEHDDIKVVASVQEIAKELTLVYRFLAVERKFTEDIYRAAEQRDYLRVAALCADHLAESNAHDRMLNEWSEDHGFTKNLREEMFDEVVT